MPDDPRLEGARSIPIAEVAARLDVPDLKRAGHEQVGPCPRCGGKDRFSINPERGVYNCRHCGGGDGLALVQLMLNCDFKTAISWLVGDAQVQLDPAEAKRREEDRARKKASADRRAAEERRKAVARAQAIWREGRPAAGSPVAEYLSKRGIPSWITDAPPHALRYHPALPYMVPGARPGTYEEIHRGPAMLGAILAPSGQLAGVHRTWIDLAQRKGKAIIRHNGETLESKKVWGHKKGCAIRLGGPERAETLVMGEGIETTLTAMAASTYPHAAYWSGIDLGNMSGRRVTRGDGMKFAGVPDLTDEEAFLPPPWTRWLVFILDGDSDPKLTRAKILAGLRRARAKVPGVERASFVHAGEGMDLNDVLMGKGDDADREN